MLAAEEINQSKKKIKSSQAGVKLIWGPEMTGCHRMAEQLARGAGGQ
jgi:hypothetical protein